MISIEFADLHYIDMWITSFALIIAFVYNKKVDSN
jgi:hypothetical protein